MGFVGIDLHSNCLTGCRLGADGRQGFETFQLGQADTDRFCPGLDVNDEPAVEATGNSARFCGAVRPCVGRVAAVNPRQFLAIRKSVNKTDRNDAGALAFFLSEDMPPETGRKSVAEAELAALARTRDMFVKQPTMLPSKIHALCYRHGIKPKKAGLSSKIRLEGLGPLRFTALEQVALGALREAALNLSATLKQLDRAIEEATCAMPGFEGMTGIEGIGAGSARQSSQPPAGCCLSSVTPPTNGWVFEGFTTFKIKRNQFPAGPAS